ncbi:MAG: hypothetical protein DRP46_13130 [Candidatus Zixiibacteriota bacterium]|nr:MAG: hypothetical protein DRP46_13130 [candidate division Zixibacteria bacterium]
MKSQRCISFTFLIILVLATGLYASQYEIGEMKVSGMKWGPQNVTVKLVSHNLYYRFVLAETNISYSGISQVTSRHSIKKFIIEPQSDTSLVIPIEIPGGFGTGSVNVTLYDVVDTLDTPTESQAFYTGQIPITTAVPESIREIVNNGIQVPLFVEQSDDFDNLFNRLLLLLLYRGKSVEEIAEMCNTDPAFVMQTIKSLMLPEYIRHEGNRYITDISIIDSDKIEPFQQLASSAIDKLYDIITANIPAYKSTINAMVKQGKLTADPNDLLDGGSVLHHLHPAITSLFLWQKAGYAFVNDGKPFSGYVTLGLCNVMVDDFMYLVVGDSSLIPHIFYFRSIDQAGGRAVSGFADSYVECTPEYKNSGFLPVNILLGRDKYPTYYSYGESICAIPLDVLGQRTAPFLSTLKADFDQILGFDSRDKTGKGARYWFWSLIVKGLTEKLEQNGIIERESDTYIFQLVDY